MTPAGPWQASPTDYTPTTRIAQGAITAGFVTYTPDDINGMMQTNLKLTFARVLDGKDTLDPTGGRILP